VVRVLHLITSLETGGAQAMLARLLEAGGGAGRAGGVEAEVVALMPGGGLRARVEATGTPVHDLGLRRPVPDPRPVLALSRTLRARPPDVLQTWLYHADLLGTAAADLAGHARVAWNLRCSYGHASPRLSSRLAPHACALLSDRPQAIVVNSVAGRDSHAAIGYRPRRWEVIPNGFDLERWRPDTRARATVRRELGLEDGAPLVGMVARPHLVKDHPAALRATHALAAAHPGLTLALVGHGLGPDDDEGRALLAAHPGPARVVLAGERSDVPRWMAAFDVLLSASTFEGFPNVLGEALCCGTPCVATDAGDSRLLVGDARRVVDPGDPAALARALDEVLSLSPDEREALGRRGRERMRAEYGLSEVVARYRALWEELAGGCAG